MPTKWVGISFSRSTLSELASRLQLTLRNATHINSDRRNAAIRGIEVPKKHQLKFATFLVLTTIGFGTVGASQALAQDLSAEIRSVSQQLAEAEISMSSITRQIEDCTASGKSCPNLYDPLVEATTRAGDLRTRLAALQQKQAEGGGSAKSGASDLVAFPLKRSRERRIQSSTMRGRGAKQL